MERVRLSTVTAMRALWAAGLLLLVAMSTGPDGSVFANPDSHRFKATSADAALARSALVRDLGALLQEKAAERSSDGKSAILPARVEVAWFGPLGRSARPAVGGWSARAAPGSAFEARAPPHA